MSEEPAVRRGAPGRTGRRPCRPPAGPNVGQPRTGVRPCLSSSRDAARWSPRSRTPRTCRSATAGRHRRGDPGPPGRRRRVETGSGKTTQLPKICSSWAAASRDHRAHAASPDRRPAVAERIAEELGRPGRGCRLPGALRRPLVARHAGQGDDRRNPARGAAAGPRPAALRHDHHRRGPRAEPQRRLPPRYLTRLLPHRLDLKVVITSATIDPQRFADHFAALGRPVLVVEVCSVGRTPSRSATARSSTRRAPSRSTRSPGSSRRSRSWTESRETAAARTSSCSSPGARSGTPPRRSPR